MLSLFPEPAFQANRSQPDKSQPETSHRLLILENKVNISRALAPFCRMEHYELFSVSNGPECMAFLLAQRPDLVIIDAKLADSTITTMMHRRNESTNQALIIMLGQEADQPLAEALGVDDFIKRPIRPIELVARLRISLRQLKNAANSVAPQPGITGDLYFE